MLRLSCFLISQKELESEMPSSNFISAEDLIEISKKLGVPFIGDEAGVKKKLSAMLKSRDQQFGA